MSVPYLTLVPAPESEPLPAPQPSSPTNASVPLVPATLARVSELAAYTAPPYPEIPGDRSVVSEAARAPYRERELVTTLACARVIDADAREQGLTWEAALQQRTDRLVLAYRRQDYECRLTDNGDREDCERRDALWAALRATLLAAGVPDTIVSDAAEEATAPTCLYAIGDLVARVAPDHGPISTHPAVVALRAEIALSHPSPEPAIPAPALTSLPL